MCNLLFRKYSSDLIFIIQIFQGSHILSFSSSYPIQLTLNTYVSFSLNWPFVCANINVKTSSTLFHPKESSQRFLWKHFHLPMMIPRLHSEVAEVVSSLLLFLLIFRCLKCYCHRISRGGLLSLAVTRERGRRLCWPKHIVWRKCIKILNTVNSWKIFYIFMLNIFFTLSSEESFSKPNFISLSLILSWILMITTFACEETCEYWWNKAKIDIHDMLMTSMLGDGVGVSYITLYITVS